MVVAQGTEGGNLTARGVVVEQAVSEVTSLYADKGSLKRKRHEGEGSDHTSTKAVAKLKDMKKKYFTMEGTKPHQLEDMFLEQTLGLSMLMKGAAKFIEKRRQELGELTRRFDARTTRIKELEEELKKEK
ncbi:hypothetical protein GIB67_024206 [Kingdonia uniflora]|uniref:Uncharacterized protein n=1 Tax=Kingdonia uniflora TaxID=39325 RepID=A0A7J7LZG3_9MAGN|nr:hypothetical protein GIB67_024206 [Kingdonia uniflora]